MGWSCKFSQINEGSNIKKEPRLSWTEIRYNTCVVSDDKRDPELKQINEMVKDLLNKIILLG